MDAFEDLQQFQLDMDKIVCPLSYGDTTYRNQIMLKGNKIFGDRFISLNDFMPYPDYVQQLLSCSYFFMNSLRQLGLGNILLLLYLGSKVILDKSNPVYRFFIKNEIRVFSIEEAKSGNLEIIDLDKTRFNLIRVWGKNAIRSKTNQLIGLIK
ncbi:TDP-N-acetylfucosamine:lipid II N-acetylfucosaminyltransferase [Algoriphagus halophilus]|uniref:TDP-N-acetylfucosamine:lipid II N-acetylfucosaminyltransferase n=1 Tax=Algoriphagus halophilus TaxID=226505 RepID=UPI0035902953